MRFRVCVFIAFGNLKKVKNTCVSLGQNQLKLKQNKRYKLSSQKMYHLISFQAEKFRNVFICLNWIYSKKEKNS